jgi:glycosyltransferase involved in cell wall biosynthesis
VKLSVVMAVYDGEAFLREAIESVLNQSFTDFEFVIVDDASTDSTPAILDQYRRIDSRVVVLRNDSNLGPYPSANRALIRARGDVIARHDADDVSTPDRFAAQLDALGSGSDVALVISAFEVLRAGELASTVCRPPTWQPRLEWDLLFANAVGAGAHVMFPRIINGARVVFPATRRYAEDYALWCQLVRVGLVACPAQVVYKYRQHPASITACNKVEQDHWMSEIRYEYQSLYQGSDVSFEAISELSRFWRFDRSSPPANLRELESTLSRLRHGFLAYVERRYGPRHRRTLAAQLDETLDERLGYWLARSIRYQDPRAVRDLVKMASGRRRLLRASRRALRHAGGAAFRRLGGQRTAGRGRRAR